MLGLIHSSACIARRGSHNQVNLALLVRERICALRADPPRQGDRGAITDRRLSRKRRAGHIDTALAGLRLGAIQIGNYADGQKNDRPMRGCFVCRSRSQFSLGYYSVWNRNGSELFVKRRKRLKGKLSEERAQIIFIAWTHSKTIDKHPGCVLLIRLQQ